MCWVYWVLKRKFCLDNTWRWCALLLWEFIQDLKIGEFYISWIIHVSAIVQWRKLNKMQFYCFSAKEFLTTIGLLMNHLCHSGWKLDSIFLENTLRQSLCLDSTGGTKWKNLSRKAHWGTENYSHQFEGTLHYPYQPWSKT